MQIKCTDRRKWLKNADHDEPEVAPRKRAMKTQVSAPWTFLIVIIVFIIVMECKLSALIDETG